MLFVKRGSSLQGAGRNKGLSGDVLSKTGWRVVGSGVMSADKVRSAVVGTK